MKKSRRYFVVTVMSLLFLWSSNIVVYASALRFEPVKGKLRYQNTISLDNLVYTGSVNVSTNLKMSSILENEITNNNENLLLKMTFSDVQLDFFKRELQIQENEKRAVGFKDREDLERDLREQVLYKWINLIVSEKGEIIEKYHSTALKEITIVDLTQTAEQFFILLPEGKIHIGDEWFAPYSTTLPPYDQGEPFVGTVKYTYLGTESRIGVVSYKVKVHLFHEEERYLSDGGISRTSQLVSGIMYFATEGKYLVESNLSNDLSLLIIMGEEKSGSFRNFIRTRLEYNIQLIPNYFL